MDEKPDTLNNSPPTRRYRLDGLHCAQCAAEIEMELRKLEGIGDGRVNFVTGTVDINPKYEDQLRKTVKRIEPGVKVNTTLEEGSELPKLIVAAAFFAAGLVIRSFAEVLSTGQTEVFGTAVSAAVLQYLFFGMAYLLTGFGVVKAAVINIFHGKVFDENFLMTLATVGAAVIGEIPEAAAVMLFYSTGEYFQEKAVNSSRRTIRSLMSLRPEFARLVGNNGTEKVHPKEVREEDLIEIRPGERVPLDGIVVEGESFVDTSALTGEAVPRSARPGKEILAGSLNGEGVLRLRVLRKFEQSAVMRILQLVEESAIRKAPTEKFITRFARYYTPAVVVLAIGVALVPPVFAGAVFMDWVYRALLLLVISCPCALVVSIPLGYFAGVGTAARHGVLVKGGEYLDRLIEIRSIAFDKTGTLTQGVFAVQKIVPRNGFSREELLRLAAEVESNSNHPIARSIRRKLDESSGEGITESREVRGRGVTGIRIRDGMKIIAGNDRFMHELDIPHQDCDAAGTIVYVAVDGVYAGYIEISDQLKPEAPEAVKRLKSQGIEKMVLLTGDDHHATATAAESAGIDEWFCELLPEEKVKRIEELEQRKDHSPVMFIGDGINDAPVLIRAYIGMAMGGIGSDAAIEAADMVLMKDDLLALPKVIGVAKKTRRVVLQNIIFALGVKAVVAGIGIAGLASMWAAVFADVGVALLAILNSVRIMGKQER